MQVIYKVNHDLPRVFFVDL